MTKYVCMIGGVNLSPSVFNSTKQHVDIELQYVEYPTLNEPFTGDQFIDTKDLDFTSGKFRYLPG